MISITLIISIICFIIFIYAVYYITTFLFEKRKSKYKNYNTDSVLDILNKIGQLKIQLKKFKTSEEEIDKLKRKIKKLDNEIKENEAKYEREASIDKEYYWYKHFDGGCKRTEWLNYLREENRKFESKRSKLVKRLNYLTNLSEEKLLKYNNGIEEEKNKIKAKIAEYRSKIKEIKGDQIEIMNDDNDGD